jgi:MFS family permease
MSEQPLDQERQAADPTTLAKEQQTTPAPWYRGAAAGPWLALAAALLGWMFDGFEQGVFPIVSRPALVQFFGLHELDQQAQDKGLPQEERDAAKARVDEPVRRWNAIVSAAFLLGAAAGGLVFGWIGDRLGRVRAMVFSVLAYALFTGVCGLAQAPWQLGVLRFLAALGMGGEWSLGVALVMESWPARARPALAGVIGAAANVGFLATGAVGLLLDPERYWRFIFLVCVLPALLTFLLRMFVPESARWEQAVATGPKPRVGDIFVAGLRRRSLLGIALGAVPLLATWGAVTWIPVWLGQVARPLASYGQLYGALGAIVGAFLGAFLLGRFPRRLGYFILCLLSFVVCQYVFVVKKDGPYDGWFLAAVVLMGACSAAFYGWLPLYLPELFPTRVRATGQGFCYNGGRVLAAVIVILFTFGINLRGNYPLAFSLICLIYLGGMALAWFIPETKGQPLPD